MCVCVFVPKEHISHSGGIVVRYRRSGITCYLVDWKWLFFSAKLARIVQNCFLQCLLIITGLPVYLISST